MCDNNNTYTLSPLYATGIDSPGLAGSPAIAKEIVRLLGESGLKFVGKCYDVCGVVYCSVVIFIYNYTYYHYYYYHY